MYEIDEQMRTAEEVWSFGVDLGLYSRYMSSAYWTEAGNVLMMFTCPEGGLKTRFFVVDPQERVLYDARFGTPQCGLAYGAREIALDAMTIE